MLKEKIHPNESAFPHNNNLGVATGLPIRAELAARAMQGLLANIENCDRPHASGQQLYIVECAVELADKLIEQLNKTE